MKNENAPRLSQLRRALADVSIRAEPGRRVYCWVMDWPRRRGALLEGHAALEARHAGLTAPGVPAGHAGAPHLHELREHHEELQEHHAALAAYQTALADLPPLHREALTLATTLAAAEVMLVEAGRAADEAREAWRRATDVYKKVRDMLDRGK